VGISTENSFDISLWLYGESFSERPSGQTNANSAKLARTATSILANFLFMVCCQIERVEFTFFLLWKSRVRIDGDIGVESPLLHWLPHNGQKAGWLGEN
jgi:hypothetical protein